MLLDPATGTFNTFLYIKAALSIKIHRKHRWWVSTTSSLLQTPSVIPTPNQCETYKTMQGAGRQCRNKRIPFDAVKEALRQQAEKDSVVAALVPPSSVLGTVTEDDVDHQRAWMSQSYDAGAQPRSSPIVPPRSTSLHGKKSRFYTDVPDDQQPSAEKRSLSTSAAPDRGN